MRSEVWQEVELDQIPSGSYWSMASSIARSSTSFTQTLHQTLENPSLAKRRGTEQIMHVCPICMCRIQNTCFRGTGLSESGHHLVLLPSQKEGLVSLWSKQRFTLSEGLPTVPLSGAPFAKRESATATPVPPSGHARARRAPARERGQYRLQATKRR